MDSENISRRQDELNKIKKGLKDWEHGFFKSHKRKPTIKDIQERPKVERVYKDYHAKKKQLRLLSEEGMDSQSLSQPITFDSQQQQRYASTSQEIKAFSPASSPSSQPQSPSQKRRRGSQASVEYIRSPSHRLSRIKYVDQLERPSTSLDFGTKPNTHSGTSATGARSTSTDADSFWLSNSQDSSRPTGFSSGDIATSTTAAPDPSSSTPNISNNSSFFFSADNINGTTLKNSSTSNKKKKKKNAAALEQKLLGHLIWKPRDTLSPALKAERVSSSQPTTPTADNKMTLDSQAVTQPNPDTTTTITTSTQEDTSTTIHMITDEILSPLSPSRSSTITGKTIDDLKLDGLVIAEHEQDPFRHFDPDLINHLKDPDSFVMPGLFASARARSTIMAPMTDDDGGRYKRILEALEQGTLGEKRRDDDQLDDMGEGLKRFLDENTDSFAEQIDTTDQEEKPPPYRKKFTQKRQTRLHKFKYVETSPSGL